MASEHHQVANPNALKNTGSLVTSTITDGEVRHPVPLRKEPCAPQEFHWPVTKPWQPPPAAASPYVDSRQASRSTTISWKHTGHTDVTSGITRVKSANIAGGKLCRT